MVRLKYIVICLFLCQTFLFSSYENSVVRIHSSVLMYDYKYPYKDAKQKNIFGSGVIIKNNYILTAAHVIRNAQKIIIKKHGSEKKYYAKVQYLSFQADLALLKVYDNSFFKNTLPLTMDPKVNINDKISIIGYPLAKKTAVKQIGKIEDIKYKPYAFSNENLLALQLDIAIKEGYSGGPVINDKGNLIGIAMQIQRDTHNRAYAISSNVIATFLNDINDKKVDGFHSNDNTYEYLNNSQLQNYYNINTSAMRVTHTDIFEQQLKVNDIILTINGKNISNKHSFKNNKAEFFSQFHTKAVGQNIQMTVLREGKKINISYTLNFHKKLVAQEFNEKPRYFIFAGLIFTPMTRNYLQAIGMNQYEMNMLFYGKSKTVYLSESVAWMQTKFLHEVNKGYESKVEIVHKMNNSVVKSFEHFVSLIQSSQEEYIVIDFINKRRIVLQKEQALKSFSSIQSEYKLLSNEQL